MAKMSENSVKILGYLKDHADENLTAANVAEALDLTVSQVNGTFTSLSNKDLGSRVEATVPGAIDVSFLAITDDGETADISEISENGQAIMGYLKDVKGQNVTADDACEALGIEKRKFTGAFNSLVKKGLATRNAAKVEGTVTVKYFKLNDAGIAFDPSEAE